MYHREFIKARNINGKQYRDEKSGNLVEYCSHSYMLKPQWVDITEMHEEFIPQNKKAFDGFVGICVFCGDITHIQPENVLSEERYEKELNRLVLEISTEEQKFKEDKNARPKKNKKNIKSSKNSVGA
jgi:hypothetical protein